MFVPEWYKLDAWKRRRREAIEAAGGKCGVCGGQGQLEAHHVDGYESYIQFLTTPLWIVCRDCHRDLHDTDRPRRKAWRRAAMEV